MKAHEIEVMIPEDHRLVVKVPEELRTGPARLILIQPSGVSEGEPKRQRLPLKSLPKRDGLNCTFDELVATSWEHAWNPDS